MLITCNTLFEEWVSSKNMKGSEITKHLIDFCFYFGGGGGGGGGRNHTHASNWLQHTQLRGSFFMHTTLYKYCSQTKLSNYANFLSHTQCIPVITESYSCKQLATTYSIKRQLLHAHNTIQCIPVITKKRKTMMKV